MQQKFFQFHMIIPYINRSTSVITKKHFVQNTPAMLEWVRCNLHTLENHLTIFLNKQLKVISESLLDFVRCNFSWIAQPLVVETKKESLKATKKTDKYPKQVLFMDGFDDDDEEDEDEFSEGFETIDEVEDFEDIVEEDFEDNSQDIIDEGNDLDLQEERFFEEGEIDEEEDAEENLDDKNHEFDENLAEFVNDEIEDTDEDYYYGEYEQ